MADRTPRREIKLKITQPEPRAALKPQYVYRWDRIFGALTALVLLMALVGYGLYAWLRPASPPASAEAEEVPAQELTTAKTAQQSEGAVQESVPEIAAEDQETGADSPAMLAASPAMESDTGRSPIPAESVSEGLSRQALSESLEVDPLRLAEAGLPPLEIAEPVPAPVSIDDALTGQTPEAQPMVEPAPKQPRATDEIAESAPVQIPAGEETAAQAPTQSPAGGEIAEPAPAPTPDTEESAESAPGETAVSESGDTDQHRSKEQGQPGEASSESSDTEGSAELAQEPASEPEPDTAAAPAAAPEEETGKGLFRSQNVSISSPAVKRFVLAESVTGKAPKGNLADITMSAKGVAPVSVFSEVVGLEGEVLEYRWLHNGERVLRIRVPVGGKRWRSHTTKKIYKRMKGAWRVELRDSAGQLLASGDFVF